MSVSPYSVGVLINSIAGAVDRLADNKAWRDRQAYRQKAMLGGNLNTQPDETEEEPKAASKKSTLIINTALGAVCTGAAAVALCSDKDGTKEAAMYTAVVAGTVLTAINGVKILA